MTRTDDDWLNADEPTKDETEVLYVDVDGYEGPLDLLLDMARRQKVDLANVSVLKLAEQYLAFIETIRQKRIEVAADYLVMAAWLAYLKSRLMVPSSASDDEPDGEMMAAMLQFRLKRLEAMRKAGEQLVKLPRRGRDVFVRGMPESITVQKTQHWEATLYDLLKAYAIQRERGAPTDYVLAKRNVWALQEARELLERVIGESTEWLSIESYLAQYLTGDTERASVLASSFSASLELVREGYVELRQASAFAPLLMRRRADRMKDDDGK